MKFAALVQGSTFPRGREDIVGSSCGSSYTEFKNSNKCGDCWVYELCFGLTGLVHWVGQGLGLGSVIFL